MSAVTVPSQRARWYTRRLMERLLEISRTRIGVDTPVPSAA
jgi:hypothetical protein